MTRDELVSLFGEEFRGQFSLAVARAKRESHRLADKICTRYSVETSFSLDEIVFICGFVRPRLNPLELELVKENYIGHDRTYIPKKSPYIEGTEDFLKKIERNPKFKCCANCAFIRGRTVANHGRRLRPYCAFYGRYLERTKVHLKNRDRWCDIFKDSCGSYRRGKIKFFFRET